MTLIGRIVDSSKDLEILVHALLSCKSCEIGPVHLEQARWFVKVYYMFISALKDSLMIFVPVFACSQWTKYGITI